MNGWEVLEDFCRHYYGERLAATMTDYYRKVAEACQLVFNGDPIVGPYIDMTWPPMDPVMRRAKTADVLQAAEIHRGLLGDLDKQEGLMQGWQSYWQSYAKIFAALEKKVRDKLSSDQ